VVSDGISKEEISAGTASNAAAALEKVTGVSVVDGGYVYVRGLGERYSATMLNSAMIPTTEPEKRVVPLDLFPANLIEGIKVLKAYSPDLPGEFSGGLVQMTTVQFPTSPMFRVSTSYGFNSRTSFERFLSSPGGSRDFFGLGSGSRALPEAIPADSRLFPGSYSRQELQSFGQAFDNTWEPTPMDTMRPSQTYSMVGGGTYGRFGLVGALTFTNKPQFQGELQRYVRQEGTRPVLFTEYEDFRSYLESARLGAVFNVAVRLTPMHKLVFRNTLTRDTDKESREFAGYDGGVDGFIQSQRLRYIERGLLSTSVEGDHTLPALGDSLLHWQFTYSMSERDEPDLREVIRGLMPDGRYSFSALGSSGLRFFNNLQDRIYEPQVEFGKPFYRGSVSGLIKTGFRGTFRSRDFQARRFRYIPQDSRTLDFFAPSNQLFAPSNIRRDGFEIVEFTRATDRYDALMDVYAGYVMADVALGGRWRIVGGLRVEDANIEVSTLDPLVPYAQGQLARLANRDPMPGVNVIYALGPRQNLRASYSKTVSRPDFRELSPFDFNNVLGGFVAQGNPNLLRATVSNYDVRYEWFWGGNQVFAAGFFAKDFTDPIEVTILPSNDLRQTYVNAAGAMNRGVELELRKSMGFLSRRLRDLSLQSNFTVVDSDIRIRESDATLLTSRNRPLLGQSRYIGNVVAEWAKPSWRSNMRFYLTSVSRRLSDVGTFGLPDIYQERNTFVDFVYQYTIGETGKWQMRFNAENLADNHYRWSQGEFLQRSFRLGRTYSVGLAYSIF
jgi:outer membrane receptor protein involved in Fe transport